MRQKFTLFFVACVCALVSVAGFKSLPTRFKGHESEINATKAKLENRKNLKFRNFEKFHKNRGKAVKADASEEVLLFEDFANLTGGSESAPGDMIFDEDGYVLPDLLSSEDWEGWAVYQAAGTAYFGQYEAEDEETGEPYTDTGFMGIGVDLEESGMGGTVKISGKVKSSASSDSFIVVFINDATEEEAYDQITINGSWKNYESTFNAPAGYYFAQIYPLSSPAFLDDFKISFEKSKSAPNAPLATEATNISPNAFTANWKAAIGADSYLVSAFSLDESGPGETTVTEGFDGIVLISGKNIDDANSTFPEGWNISITTNGNSRHGYNTAGNYGTAAPSLCFDATGDFIETPVAATPISKFSFWAKPQSADATSSVKIEGYDGSTWKELDNITADKFAGDVFDFKFSAGDILAFRLSYTKGKGNVAIDDISYTYGGPSRNYLVTDQPATDLFTVINGTSEDIQYYYVVKAVNEYGTSPESNVVKVGERYDDPEFIEAPVSLPATDISTAGFTANWQEAFSAQFYSVAVGLNHKAVADETYTLADENFDNQTLGTIESPVAGDWLSDFDEFTTRPDWFGVSTCYAAGCVGFDNAEEMLFAPCIMSPNYNLAANGGKVKVKFDVYTTEASTVSIELYQGETDEGDGEEPIAVSTKADEDEDDDAGDDADLPLDVKTVAAGPSWKTVEIELSNATDLCYFQISADGETTKCFIDNIIVSKDLKAGDSVDLPYAYYAVDAPLTSADISTSDFTPGDSYNYYVVAAKEDATGEDYVMSESSEIQYVTPSGVEKVNGEDNISRAYVKFGTLIIDNPAGKDVNVYNANGAHIYSSRGEHSSSVSLAMRGVYIVKVGNKVTKVVR